MGQIVAIHSFRGGTGKSNLTANIATTVAMQGSRVGIVDTDIQSPGIHVLFGMDSGQFAHTLNDYLFGNCSITDTALDVSTSLRFPDDSQAVNPGSVYFIPSSIDADEIAAVLQEGYDVGLLIDGFRDLMDVLQLDFLFIDTHPGLNEETLLSIAVSHTLIVVLRPDQQDFQGTAVTIEVSRKLSVPKLVLVINKVPPGFDKEKVRRQVESAYTSPVAGIIPLSVDLASFASRGIFCLHHTDHEITREIQKITSYITTG